MLKLPKFILKFILVDAMAPSALVASLSGLAIGAIAAKAQEYPGCFLMMQGEFVDLSSLCGGSASSTANSAAIVFSNLKLQSIFNDSLLEVVGTATNPSSQVMPISVVYFQLVAGNQVLTSSAIEVEAGNGLAPGQSMEFSKVISASDLQSYASSGVAVQVTQYR